ncbi:MAG: hypothetical protein P8078_05880 [bacterium]
MKDKFDKLSLRGVIAFVIASAGLIYEVFFSSETEIFLLVFYGIVLMIALYLIFFLEVFH